MKVSKVLRTSVSSARVILDNGWCVKIPVELLHDEFVETDFIETVSQYKKDLLYRTMVKPKRVPRIPKMTRDMSQFNAFHEFQLLRSIVSKNAKGFNWFLNSEELDDLTSDIFLHFWERNLFQGYDATVVSYLSYLSRAVQNFMIDKFRSNRFQTDQRLLSLDKPVKSDSDATLASFVEAPNYNPVIDPALRLQFEHAVYALDCDGTGLIGVTYSDIFHILFDGASFEDLVSRSGYSRTTIANRRDRLVEWLRPIYNEWRLAC